MTERQIKMKRYDQPKHPAVWFLTVIAALIGVGVMMTAFNQAHYYFAGRSPAAVEEPAVTDGRGHSER